MTETLSFRWIETVGYSKATVKKCKELLKDLHHRRGIYYIENKCPGKFKYYEEFAVSWSCNFLGVAINIRQSCLHLKRINLCFRILLHFVSITFWHTLHTAG